MKLGKIYTFENASEAKKLVGKRVIVGNCLAEIASDCLKNVIDYIPNYDRCILTGIEEEDFYPFWVIAGTSLGERFQFIREIIEEEKSPMTNRQLSEWLARGFGQTIRVDEKKQIDPLEFIFTHYNFREKEGGDLVDQDIRIRSWDSKEWVEPTADIYKRDCKA